MAAISCRGLLHCVVLIWSLYIHLRQVDARILQETFLYQVEVQTAFQATDVDKNFICATLDWWPSEKCSANNVCPWGGAGLPYLDLENPKLLEAMKELRPLVRAGGTLENIVVYDIGGQLPSEPCVNFTVNEGVFYGFSGGCLTMERWDALNAFFKKTGVEVVFGLNALYGRNKTKTTTGMGSQNVTGPWNWTNAYELMKYTRKKNYAISGWELGNELMGLAIDARVNPLQYSKDLRNLDRIVREVYKGHHTLPLVIAPDLVYLNISDDLKNFLTDSGREELDVLTTHSYNLGSGDSASEILISNLLNRTFFTKQTDTYKSVNTLLRDHPAIKAWIGESGGVYGSGRHGVSDTFIDAFWYLDELGTASLFNTKVFCRQSFVGGNYGLLDRSTFEPNPDYYGALLWRRLMGERVLFINVLTLDYISAYAHCQKDNKGGVTVLLLNFSNTTTASFNFNFLGSNKFSFRHEYHMSPADGNITSQVVLLNGQPLAVTSDGKIPRLLPVNKAPFEPISLKPLTYAYIVFPDVHASACERF
ncbi:hypothetical protein MPTK1_7g02870 [Marchantia polymorpha subsp. ruderalis]|uniref:Uncharacterized protein n=2 Tax=Marchantia polymorpha TaxID=3197 RepID=A0AAF6BVI6_MARPO|nr:hypothetical protein MARPO_0968s0001 [Marchantia polymorpha]BBN16020.1 hypothetical protein Mp_7g02870 [Marchantia polymorpha subsp. ruderalis]|eukprot:PTQ26565.1 hypothetical protein MARPO_0968s0001 [Marchantia polymorpha]